MAEGGMGFKHANVEAWHICLAFERFAFGVLVLVLVLGVLRIRPFWSEDWAIYQVSRVRTQRREAHIVTHNFGWHGEYKRERRKSKDNGYCCTP
jgi:hypothetical protein